MAQTGYSLQTFTAGNPTKASEQTTMQDNIEAALFVELKNDNGSTAVKGKAVYLKTDGDVDLAKADALSTIDSTIGLWFDTPAAAATGSVQTQGIMTGLTGLTRGATYYVDPDTAGDLVASEANALTTTFDSGEFIIKVGVALATDELLIQIGSPIERDKLTAGSRSIWVQPHHVNGTGTTLSSNVGDHGSALFGNNNANQAAYFSFSVPADYDATTKATLLVVTQGAAAPADMKWTTDTDMAASGQARALHSDSNPTQTASMTQDQLLELDHTGVVDLVEALDYVGLKFTRLGTDGNDNITTLNVIGFLFEYTT